MSQDTGKSSKTEDSSKEIKSSGSFLQNLKSSLFGEIDMNEDKKIESGREISESSYRNEPSPGKDPVHSKEQLSGGKESYSKKETVLGIEPISKKTDRNSRNVSSGPDEDPTINMFKNIKEHEKLQSLRKRKNKIIKVVAIITSILLIFIGIILSITPNEKVASNVIFGERAMFSVLLILIAFMILAAVFASRLLQAKFLKGIHEDLEIVEGKKIKEDQKDTGTDPIIERMNKKNK